MPAIEVQEAGRADQAPGRRVEVLFAGSWLAMELIGPEWISGAVTVDLES